MLQHLMEIGSEVKVPTLIIKVCDKAKVYVAPLLDSEPKIDPWKDALLLIAVKGQHHILSIRSLQNSLTAMCFE